MSVEVGNVYKSSSGNMVLLVISLSASSAQCVVIWASDKINTAYRVGETDRWSLHVIDRWKRVN